MKDFDTPYIMIDGDLYHSDSTGLRQRVCHSGGAIALAYDRVDGVLHKHGEYNAVASWYQATRTTLMKHASTSGLGEALVLVTMPLEERWVRELNRCIAVTGAVMGVEDCIRDGYLAVLERAVPATSPPPRV
jgi:hypothetical protein